MSTAYEHLLFIATDGKSEIPGRKFTDDGVTSIPKLSIFQKLDREIVKEKRKIEEDSWNLSLISSSDSIASLSKEEVERMSRPPSVHSSVDMGEKLEEEEKGPNEEEVKEKMTEELKGLLEKQKSKDLNISMSRKRRKSGTSQPTTPVKRRTYSILEQMEKIEAQEPIENESFVMTSPTRNKLLLSPTRRKENEVIVHPSNFDVRGYVVQGPRINTGGVKVTDYYYKNEHNSSTIINKKIRNSSDISVPSDDSNASQVRLPSKYVPKVLFKYDPGEEEGAEEGQTQGDFFLDQNNELVFEQADYDPSKEPTKSQVSSSAKKKKKKKVKFDPSIENDGYHPRRKKNREISKSPKIDRSRKTRRSRSKEEGSISSFDPLLISSIDVEKRLVIPKPFPKPVKDSNSTLSLPSSINERRKRRNLKNRSIQTEKQRVGRKMIENVVKDVPQQQQKKRGRRRKNVGRGRRRKRKMRKKKEDAEKQKPQQEKKKLAESKKKEEEEEELLMMKKKRYTFFEELEDIRSQIFHQATTTSKEKKGGMKTKRAPTESKEEEEVNLVDEIMGSEDNFFDHQKKMLFEIRQMKNDLIYEDLFPDEEEEEVNKKKNIKKEEEEEEEVEGEHEKIKNKGGLEDALLGLPPHILSKLQEIEEQKKMQKKKEEEEEKKDDDEEEVDNEFENMIPRIDPNRPKFEVIKLGKKSPKVSSPPPHQSEPEPEPEEEEEEESEPSSPLDEEDEKELDLKDDEFEINSDDDEDESILIPDVGDQGEKKNEEKPEEEELEEEEEETSHPQPQPIHEPEKEELEEVKVGRRNDPTLPNFSNFQKQLVDQIKQKEEEEEESKTTTATTKEEEEEENIKSNITQPEKLIVYNKKKKKKKKSLIFGDESDYSSVMEDEDRKSQPHEQQQQQAQPVIEFKESEPMMDVIMKKLKNEILYSVLMKKLSIVCSSEEEEEEEEEEKDVNKYNRISLLSEKISRFEDSEDGVDFGSEVYKNEVRKILESQLLKIIEEEFNNNKKKKKKSEETFMKISSDVEVRDNTNKIREKDEKKVDQLSLYLLLSLFKNHHQFDEDDEFLKSLYDRLNDGKKEEEEEETEGEVVEEEEEVTTTTSTTTTTRNVYTISDTLSILPSKKEEEKEKKKTEEVETQTFILKVSDKEIQMEKEDDDEEEVEGEEVEQEKERTYDMLIQTDGEVKLVPPTEEIEVQTRQETTEISIQTEKVEPEEPEPEESGEEEEEEIISSDDDDGLDFDLQKEENKVFVPLLQQSEVERRVEKALMSSSSSSSDASSLEATATTTASKSIIMKDPKIRKHVKRRKKEKEDEKLLYTTSDDTVTTSTSMSRPNQQIDPNDSEYLLRSSSGSEGEQDDDDISIISESLSGLTKHKYDDDDDDLNDTGTESDVYMSPPPKKKKKKKKILDDVGKKKSPSSLDERFTVLDSLDSDLLDSSSEDREDGEEEGELEFTIDELLQSSFVKYDNNFVK